MLPSFSFLSRMDAFSPFLQIRSDLLFHFGGSLDAVGLLCSYFFPVLIAPLVAIPPQPVVL
jgi:hypothetical protein